MENDTGNSVRHMLSSLGDFPSDLSDYPYDFIKHSLLEGSDYFNWYDGDIICGIRPYASSTGVEVNGVDIRYNSSPYSIKFSVRSEKTMENEYNHNNLSETERTYFVPTIGFCSTEKGFQGGYTIQTNDKVFDPHKVEIDIVHTSFSTYVDSYYYDGERMEQTIDPEGYPKAFEVNFGYLPQAHINTYYGKDMFTSKEVA